MRIRLSFISLLLAALGILLAAKPKDKEQISEGMRPAVVPPSLSPADAQKHFQFPNGFTVDLIAAEPVVRQPVHITFDERGRMWVTQYIQYPFPSGVKVVGHDEWWRVQYDQVSPPPPKQFKGQDKIIIFEDADGDGVFESHKDFLTILNM